MDKTKIHGMSDKQLRSIIILDCVTSPNIPTELINDYLATMTEEEKEWDEFVWTVVDELVERRKKKSS